VLPRAGPTLLLPISGTRPRPASEAGARTAAKGPPTRAEPRRLPGMRSGLTSHSLPAFRVARSDYRTRAVAAPPACTPASPALSIVSSE
jgi:hypothetical protein